MNPTTVGPFAVLDCSLARCAIGRSCTNLRELLDALRTVPDMVLEHHMMRCALDDHFDLYEFPNDLARWCWEALGDRLLAEELSLVDPYSVATIAELRGKLVNLLEAHLWGKEQGAIFRPGLELHLIGSRLVAYDTGERLSTVAALAEALPRLTLRSLFYHVHEAHRRCQADDFSTWLKSYGADPGLLTRLQKINFYFLNLHQLQDEYTAAFRHHQQSISQPVMRASA